MINLFLFLTIVCVSFNDANGFIFYRTLNEGDDCAYSKDACATNLLYTVCPTGTKCVFNGVRSKTCGRTKQCIRTTPEPTVSPTPEPTTSIKREGEICKATKYNNDPSCSSTVEFDLSCEEGLECTGISKSDACSNYNYCRTPPTPSPTEPPIVVANVGEACCPVPPDDKCGNNPPCSGDNRCVGTYFNQYVTNYACQAPPPTPEPTVKPTKSPTIQPTQYSPLEGDMCADCEGAEFYNSCPEGLYCIPNNEQSLTSECSWSCQSATELPGTAIDDSNPFIVTSSSKTGQYESIAYVDAKFVVAANPSQSKIDVYNGQNKVQTHSNSGNFGTSMSTFGDWLMVGAPNSGGGAVYFYKSVGEIIINNGVVGYSTGDGHDSCGKSVVILNNDYSFAACDDSIRMYKYSYSDNDWFAYRSFPKPESNWENFGKSMSVADDTLIVGFDGGVYVVDIIQYIINGKRTIQFPFITFYRTTRPKDNDPNFGDTVVINKADGYVLVGSNSNKVHKFRWNGQLDLSEEQLIIYDVPSHDIKIDPYTYNDMSFAHSNSVAMIFKDGNFISSEWGPPFTSHSTFNKPSLVYPIANQKMVYARDDRITIVDMDLTPKPTKQPTPEPTESPTASPTYGEFYDYAERNGRSCGISQSQISKIPLTTDQGLEYCKKVCTTTSNCRCFDYLNTYDNQVLKRECTFYTEYDSDITWTAGRTHSYVKKSLNLLNVKLTIYAFDEGGQLTTETDLREAYDVALSNIKIHTTEGQVGMIWKYTPEPYTPPSDTESIQKVPIKSNNPYPIHPTTYNGYVSIIDAKLLMIDYDFKYLRDVEWQYGAQFVVTAEIRDSNRLFIDGEIRDLNDEEPGDLVYYNSHSYRKSASEFNCPVLIGRPFRVNDPRTRICPNGMIHEDFATNVGYTNGYTCTDLFQESVQFTDTKSGTVKYYSADFEYPQVPFDHCYTYVNDDDIAPERRVNSSSLIDNRAESKSQFIFTPDSHNIDWDNYGAAGIADPAVEPVVLKLYNFQDLEPMVISDIEIHDERGNKIRALGVDDITIVDDDVSKRLVSGDSELISCPYAGTKPFKSCKDFDYGPCCGKDVNFIEESNKLCSGTTISTEVLDGNKNIDHCKASCNDDVECIGIQLIESGTVRTCKYYSVLGDSIKCPFCSPTFKSSCYKSEGGVKSTRLPAKYTLAKVYNEYTTSFFGCSLPSSRVDLNIQGADSTYTYCSINRGTGKTDQELLDTVPWYNPPKNYALNSRAVIEIELNGTEVEYIDIGVGSIDGSNKPSSFYYEMYHHGVKINDGVFYRDNDQQNRKTIHINNAGDSNNESVLRQYIKSSAMKVYSIFCDNYLGDSWYNSHTIMTIIDYGGITIGEFCDDLDMAFKVSNPSLFNDIVYLFQIELETIVDGLSFLDGTYNSFIAYEMSNQGNYPTSVESVASAINFLISIDKMFDCTDTTDPEKLNNFNALDLAESLILEYRFPEFYKSWCDNYKHKEDMYYKGHRYNIGRKGAPCVSNAMCSDDLICVDYYCAETSETNNLICSAGKSTTTPLYFGLRPKYQETGGCAWGNVMTDEYDGSFTFKNSDDHAKPPWVSGNTWLQYDEHWNRVCDPDNYVQVDNDHFKTRGNIQECNNFFSSEITDSGTGIQLDIFGSRSHCDNPTFLEYLDNALDKQGEYYRLIPRKIWTNNRDILNPHERGDYYQLPSSFALTNGDEMEDMRLILDQQCLYPNRDDLMFSATGAVNELSCGEIDGCVWSDSLRKCVASRINVEANFCPMINDDDQCRLTGFCTWNENDDTCGHSEYPDYQYDPNRNKENLCALFRDPIDCGKASCVWDLVQQNCHATWDTVVQFHDAITLSSVYGSSGSLNDFVVLANPADNWKKKLDNTIKWPACSDPGKLDKGHQFSWYQWTYYPSPGVNRFMAGYEQGNNVGAGMRWEGSKRRIKITYKRQDYYITYSPVYWRQPSIEKVSSTTNKLCFDRDDLYDEKMCLGYGFKWNERHGICSFSDDYSYNSVDSLIPIAANAIYYDAGKDYARFNSPNEHTWDDMVREHFDDNDHYDIKMTSAVTYHGYQFMKFGCYTRTTKAHCENTEGMEQDTFIYGVRYERRDQACMWLPKLKTCVQRSGKDNLYRSIFMMPPLIHSYNSTIGSQGNNPYVDSVPSEMSTVDSMIFHWDSQFEKNYNPYQAKDLIKELDICSAHVVYDECVMNEACYWDWETYECVPSYCSALMFMMPQQSFERTIFRSLDLGDAVTLTKACDRIIGCKMDPVTQVCGPDLDQNFNECEDGYTMVNNYMHVSLCPDDKVLVGEYCVDPDKVLCPWGLTDYYQPSYMNDYDFRAPEEWDKQSDGSFVGVHSDVSQLENWGPDKEFPKIKHSMCKHPWMDPDRWPKAKKWDKDYAFPGNNVNPRKDQGIQSKCIAYDKPDKDPTPTWEHHSGEINAFNRAYCASMKENYGKCNIHVKGKDFVCIDIGGDCNVRYMSAESISPQNLLEYIRNEIYSDNPENADVEQRIMAIYDYTDSTFDINSEAFFNWFYTDADLYFMDGLKDKILTSQQLEERFGYYYVDEPYQNISRYQGFNDTENWPKYDPVYEIIEMPTLHIDMLGDEISLLMKPNYQLDLFRQNLAEKFSVLYFQWREILMLITDYRVDQELQMRLSAEVNSIRDWFWSDREFFTDFFNTLWESSFENSTDYSNAVRENSISNRLREYNSDNPFEDFANAYTYGEVSEFLEQAITPESTSSTYYFRSSHLEKIHHHTYHGILLIQHIDDYMDSKYGKSFFSYRYNFDVQSTVEIISSFLIRLGGTDATIKTSPDWPGVVVKEKAKTIVDVEVKKVSKWTSTQVPYIKRNEKLINKLVLEKRAKLGPLNLDIDPPKEFDTIPLPEEQKVQPFKGSSKKPVPYEVQVEILNEIKSKRRPKFVPAGAGKSGDINGKTHHASMKTKYAQSWKRKQYKDIVRSELTTLSLEEKKLFKSKVSAGLAEQSSANARKRGAHIANKVRIMRANDRRRESVKLRNQFIQVTNKASKLEHNMKNTEKMSSMLNSWQDDVRTSQKPNIRLEQTVDSSTSIGLAKLKRRAETIIETTVETKKPAIVSLIPKNSVETVVRKYKYQNLIDNVAWAGEKFKKIFEYLEILDIASSVMDIYNNIYFALNSPIGCTAFQEVMGWGAAAGPKSFLKNFADPTKAAIRARFFLGVSQVLIDKFIAPHPAISYAIGFAGKTRGLEADKKCAETISWAMHNADGRYGIVDDRYEVSECEREYNYRVLDDHFSNNEKGLNIDCDSDEVCKYQSSIGRCVYGRCVYPVHYIGMKVCEDMVDPVQKDIAPVIRQQYLTTNYDTFASAGKKAQPEKFVSEDEIEVGNMLIETCNTRFAEYHYDKLAEKGSDIVYCFNDCDVWSVNRNVSIDTWMLTMPRANFTSNSEVDTECTTSDDCTNGGICANNHKCTPPIECSEHKHCYGGYYLPGRLPRCDCITFTCVDDTASNCGDIESCTSEANTICEMPNVAPPTEAPTSSPTEPPSPRPTESPTASPTMSPTVTYTLPIEITFSPTSTPTASPTTVAPSNSPTTLAPTKSPTTESPTRSPTVPGPLAGSECEFQSIDYYLCRGDYKAYIPDIDAFEETIEFTNGDYSTCESACRNTIECKLFYVETLPDNKLKCTYYSEKGPTLSISPIPGPSVVGCFEKQIPCVPTASPTYSPTLSPVTVPTTLAPTSAPTSSPVYNSSSFDLHCDYGTILHSRLVDYTLLEELLQIDTEYQCMEICDLTSECIGFEHEMIARKCLLYSQVSSLTSYSRSTVYQKNQICPVTGIPTPSPTAYVKQYGNVSENCDYEEIGFLEIEEYASLLELQNSTVEQCIAICDEERACGMVSYTNITGIPTCRLHVPPVIEPVKATYDNGYVWFNKTQPYCIITPRPTTEAPTDSPTTSPTISPTESPTLEPTKAPTVMPDWCNFTITENSTFAEFTVDDVITDVDEIFYCQKPCNARSTCVGFSFNTTDMSCVLMSSYNESSSIATTDTEIHIKDEPTCVATLTPTVSPTNSPTSSPTTAAPTLSAAPTTIAPTLSPTSSPTDFYDQFNEGFEINNTAAPTPPTLSPTLSPTSSPTLSPTAAPTETITCNYARLPGFGPRADALFVIQHESHNDTIPHSERSCLLACDRSDRCVAFTHNSVNMDCTFYDIIGPIELKLGEPVVFNVKSRSCVVPHVLEDEEGGCQYTERPEQYAEEFLYASGRSSMTGSPNVYQCGVECDRDSTCKMFTYNQTSGTCYFYYAVTQWGVDTFSGGYVKSDPNCLYAPPTLEPTNAPSPSPTTGVPSSAPTNAPSSRPTSAPTTNSTGGGGGTNVDIDITEDPTLVHPVGIVIIVLSIVSCCGFCCILCARRQVNNYAIIRRRRQPLYAIEGTLEVDF
jgi:hypothetical protein